MIETTWDKERGIILRRLEGEVSFSDMVACTKEGPTRDDFDAYRTTIWDFGKVKFTGDAETMAQQMPFVRDLTRDTGDGRKIAWVTTSPFTKALLEEYYRNNAWSSEWRVFDTTEEAIEWAAA